MINIQKFPGKHIPDGSRDADKNFVTESYDDFMTKMKAVEGLTEHRLKDSAGGRPIYGYSIGDINNKDVIFFDGYIHKMHEWRTSYFIKHFMQCLADPTENYPAMAKKINSLKNKYSFFVIPVVSPDEWDASFSGNYQNGNNDGVMTDITTDWNWVYDPLRSGEKPFDSNESQNIRDFILQYKPVGYVNCHSWGGRTGYMIRHPQNEALTVMAHDVFKSIGTSIKIREGTEARVDNKNPNPSTYNWAGDQFSRRGQKILSFVFEPASIEEPEWQSMCGVTGLLLFAIHFDHYLTKNSLTLYQ